MLRTIFVSLILVFGLSQAVRGPFYALLFYFWLAYFRPEGWLWFNWFTQLNLSLIVAIWVMFTSIFSSDRVRIGLGPIVLLFFLAQSFNSTLHSSQFDYAWIYFFDFVKITIMGYFIFMLVNTEERLRWTLIVIAVSIGFEGVKQGYANLVLSPGAKNGNEIYFLGDNNGVAVGMFMLIPVVVALARTSSSKWERFGFQFAAAGLIYRALITYSRGGFLSAGTVAMHYILRSKRKLVSVVAIALVAGFAVTVLPTEFWTRMSTIGEAAEDPDAADGSIKGRWHFWGVALLMANDKPFTGVGHNSYNVHYDQYDFTNGRFKTGRSVHSSWLGLLSELGYPGLILFILVLGTAFWQLFRVGRLARQHPELQTLALYASALEAALLAFCVGGTFVIFQYNEMLWHFFALSFTVNKLANDKLAALAPPLLNPVAVNPRLALAGAARSALPPKTLAS